ncbi:methyl-accepting chemotaxis protein [Pusillimonas sp. SM2304]|uniref:methyl-accepting chemotaxis protein n=1 Tax=Pusillimonas sp. SM2304 TaxID=3073241 RepID=UPI002876BC5B|nr:methyl-accepting chemotaxis protein [Pusillimonas sp. SM2304]MDS1141151.1 methyl-accepting chemotaxis protein [Pusillimonas sp. SM2304]
MNWLANLTVKTKLIGGFLIVAFIAGIIGVVGLYSLQQVHRMAEQMYGREIVGMRAAADARGSVIAVGRDIRSAIVAEPQHRQAYIDAVKSDFSVIYTNFDRLKGLFVTESGLATVGQARSNVEAYEKAVNSVIGTLSSQAADSAEQARLLLTSQAAPLGDKAVDGMYQLVDRKQSDSSALDQRIKRVYDSASLTMIGLTAVGVIIAFLLGWLITRSLTRQLGGEPGAAARVANAIARGDLSGRIDTSRANDGSVIHAMSVMQAALRNIVSSVRASSDSIATGSGQISYGNADLSQRTEEQAANLTETAAAMEELSSTVKSNADVAQQAAHLAQAASGAAVKGGEVVGEVVQTMDEINTSSKKIVDIIAVIDSIAFQTNILALNAAVEAARAGEQGRGFAVVASEVRSLAQKSAAAAKDIKLLIDESVSRAQAGSQMVDAAGEAMTGIVTQVQRVTDLISEISAATNEQTTGIAQVNDAVLQLSDVTQQNAALVEQSASASSSLNEQAKALVEVVSIFKLGQEEARLKQRDARDAKDSRPVAALARPSAAPDQAKTPAKTASPAQIPAAAQQVSAPTPTPSRQALTMGKPAPVREEEWEEF